jgi:Domain of unknown function (DUF4351)
MAYVTTFERLGIEKGLKEALMVFLSQKFDHIEPEVSKAIDLLDVEQLKSLIALTSSFKSVQELKLWLSTQKGSSH